MYCGRSSPASRRALSFAWAISRATMIVPLRLTRVETGYFVSSARTVSMPLSKSISMPLAPSPGFLYASGISSEGLVSIFSSQIPSALIFALMFLSAEQLTPMPIGQLAPWRGRRITRMSCASALPPNCAPRPILCASLSSLFSRSMSRKARPVSSPVVGRLS